MTVWARHLLEQRRVLAALGGLAARSLLPSRAAAAAAGAAAWPGPELAARVAPPPAGLVRDYVRHLGGEPGAYRDTVPAHLFPQWTFPLLLRTLRGVSLPLRRIMNAGCRLAIASPLPAAGPFEVRARIEEIDDDGRRTRLH